MDLDEGQRYYLKPMNCPFHILIYKSRQRSYRELPLRLFEFGTVYRYEKSGVVHGLTRVRGMTMDDAHIFCTREQMADRAPLAARSSCSTCFAISDSTTSTSSCPPGPRTRRSAPTRSGSRRPRPCGEPRWRWTSSSRSIPGGGAFYGPKISVQARDAIGRTWQISTIQVDFQLPRRFEMEYVGEDNARHQPIMIHRALFGSIERFFGVLVEHYAGAFPTWLSPVQVRILPVRDDHGSYAQEVRGRLAAAGVRAEAEDAGEPLGARIRRAKLEKVPYILVVGDADVAAGTVGVNARGSDAPERGVGVDSFVEKMRVEAAPPAGASGAAGIPAR